MRRNYINSATPQTLQTSVNTVVTALGVVSTAGYPDAPFVLAIERGEPTEEAVLCTSYTADTFTVTRGFDGTIAASHDAGALVEHTSVAIDYRESGIVRVDEADRDALSGVDLWEGRLVYNTDTSRLNVATDLTPVWEEVFPTGGVIPFAGAAAPAGWLLCNGQAVSRTTYGHLFGVVGTAYGVGDGTTTFNVPDLRQRFPLGVAVSGTGSVLGGVGGAIDHVHTNPTTASGGAHVHTNPTTASGGSHAHVNPSTSSTGSHTHTNSDTSSTGSHTHTNPTTAAANLNHSHSNPTTSTASSHSHGSTGAPSATTNQASGDGSHGQISQPTGTHTHTTSSAGSHSHTQGTGGGALGDHSHTQGSSGSSGTHSHTQAATGSNGTHSHTIANTNDGGSHTHTQGDTSEAAAHTHTQGDTGTANPPFVTFNYVIKV